jgi:hypothetical protein
LTNLEQLAERADRAMRTFAARNTAQSIYTLVRNSPNVLDDLATLRGWSRRGDRDFVCSFGGRSATIAIPRAFNPLELARLITRTEVNVFLTTGADDLLMRELQALAQRELQRLFEDGE